MKLRRFNNNILPYPVLNAENEDVKPSLQGFQSIEVRHEVKDDSFLFTVNLTQRNQTIKNLIDEGKAQYMFVLSCPSTILQVKQLSKEPVMSIEVSKLSVNGHLDFDCFVVLSESINYTNIGFADIYEGLSFDLEAGNILVRFPHREINMDLSNEKMFASKAFVEFIRSDNKEVEISLEDDIIYISLPNKQYDQYLEIRNNGLYSDIIISSIVHEAVMVAIMEYDDDSHGKLRWADALNTLIYLATEKRYSLKRLTKENRIKKAWELSNLILKNPHERLFDSIIKIDSEMNPNNDK